jgi:IclR family transcriptional regulator, pca regulon regulatory protein
MTFAKSHMELAAAETDKTLSSFAGNPNFVLSLARGLRVIEAFHTHKQGLSIADVARKTGFSRAATRRLLVTLKLLGYAEEKGRIFSLKTRVLKLGFSSWSSAALMTIAQPFLERVTEYTHESSSIGVLDGDQVVYLARSATKRVMSITLSLGSQLPAFCTSLGRVALAALREEELSNYLDHVIFTALTPKTITNKTALADAIKRVRSDGYALIDEELELGLRSIAVPVSTAQGNVIAAMNVGAHAGRVSIADMRRRVLPVLRDNAKQLGRAITAAQV